MEKVVVYTKYNCPKCESAKMQLKLRDIEFEMKNVEDEPKYMEEALSTGFRSMPIIIVGDSEPFQYNLSKFTEVFGEL